MNSPAIPIKLEELLNELSSYDEGTRFDLLVEYAERFESVPESIAKRPFSKEHLVPGCESEAYVWVTPAPDGTLKFHFAVENPQGISAKALAVILDETLSGERAENIMKVPEEMVHTLFGRTLSMGKGQGLMGMVAMVKYLARSANKS